MKLPFGVACAVTAEGLLCSIEWEPSPEALEEALATKYVGNVLSRNRWPLLLPCHRVLAAGRRIGGFAKGTAVKEALIRFERKSVAGEKSAQ